MVYSKSRRRTYNRMNRTKTAVKEYVKSAIKASKETKNVCVSNTLGISVSASGASLSTFTIPQGDGGRSRDGDFALPIKLRLKYVLQADASDDQNMMRVMIIQSKKGLLTPNSGPGWLKCITKEMLVDYRVLYDRSHVVNAQNGTESTWSGPFYVTIPANKMRILEWDPATTTNTDPNVKGAVYIFVYSSSTAAPSPKFIYDYECSYQEH